MLATEQSPSGCFPAALRRGLPHHSYLLTPAPVALRAWGELPREATRPLTAEQRKLYPAHLRLVDEHPPAHGELLALDAGEGGAEQRVALQLVGLQRQPAPAVADLGDERP